MRGHLTINSVYERQVMNRCPCSMTAIIQEAAFLDPPQDAHPWLYHITNSSAWKVLWWWRPHAKWKTLWTQSFDEIRRSSSVQNWLMLSWDADDERRETIKFTIFPEPTQAKPRGELYWISGNSAPNSNHSVWIPNKYGSSFVELYRCNIHVPHQSNAGSRKSENQFKKNIEALNYTGFRI